ncbi:MAG: ABC transporter permease [Acidobacteriota bacterium]
MRWREALAAAWAGLAAHRLRAGLATLGVVFGVGAVIAMLSIGAGAERQALAMIERLGRDNLVVRALELEQEELAEARRRSPGLAERDADAIRQGLEGVIDVASKIEIEPYQILASSARSRARVFGVPASWPRLVALRVTEGRFFDALDEREHAQVAVIGPEVRRELFGHGPALGGRIKVNDVWLEVIGVLAESGGDEDRFEGVALAPTANVLLMPVTTAARKFDRDPQDSPLDEIVVRLERGRPMSAAATALGALLDRMHAGIEDYEIVVPEALLAQSRRTQRLFDLVMGSIAGISLLVGGIGIMNIMLASVMERTREIGVRRAVGARQLDIRVQFLAESFAISLLGGVAGTLLGVALARTVGAWAGWPTVVTAASVVLAFGVSIAVGIASGFYPASRAARLDPIDALRYE